MNVILILLAITAGVGLFAWWSNRSIGDWEVRNQAAQLQAKAHADSGSDFGQGAAAALRGEEFWENPHCTPTSPKNASLAWSAGWCCGRRELRDIWRAEP